MAILTATCATLRRRHRLEVVSAFSSTRALEAELSARNSRGVFLEKDVVLRSPACGADMDGDACSVATSAL